MSFQNELKLAKEYKDPMVLLNMLPSSLKQGYKLTLIKKKDHYILCYSDGDSVAFKKQGELLEIFQLMLAHLKSEGEIRHKKKEVRYTP